jgi:FtsZ-binding cell division protein ZapB
MSEVTLTMLILGAELGGLVLLIFMVIVFFILRRKRSDKHYVAEFISTYKKDLPARIEDFKNRLESHFYIIGDDANEVLGKISNTETRLHKRILNLYLGNNRKCLSDIRNDITSLNENWLGIMTDSLANASDVLGKTEVITQLQHDYDELKKENETIREELADAMQSMEEMLKEYSLLYAERDEKNETMERLSGEYDEIKARTEAHDKD